MFFFHTLVFLNPNNILNNISINMMNTMSIKPTVEIDPDDVVRYLLYQQFYYGEDRIYGRTKNQFEYIEGAGEVIESFYLLITKPLNLIDEGYPDQYLKFFNEDIHIIPIKDIMDKYRDYEKTLGSDMNRQMILTVIVGESLTKIHTTCFKSTINQLIEFIFEKKSLNLNDPNQKAEIKKKIESLYGKSNPFIGMLYSLSFMKFIAEKVGDHKIIVKSSKLLEKYYRLILDVLKDFH